MRDCCMKERPIFFNGEMVRAVLEGRKTQTRRIMKVQPESNQLGLLRITDSTKHSDIGKYHWAESNATGTHTRSKLFSCPFGAVGDRLYVRETHSIRVEPSEYSPGAAWYRESDIGRQWEGGIRWHPSIHMPRWASRITLEITGVRVERLQDISPEDAAAEGLTGRAKMHDFGVLWSSIYGDENWHSNPWVWVIEFKRMEGVHVQTS